MKKRKIKEEVIELKSLDEDLIEESSEILETPEEVVTEKLLDDKYNLMINNKNLLDYEKTYATVYELAFANDRDFVQAKKELKLGLDIISKDMSDVEKEYQTLKKYGFSNASNNITNLNKHFNLTLALQRNVLRGFIELKELYLNKISISLVAITMGKKIEDLIDLKNRIDEKLGKNDHFFDKTYEEIYYHSSELIHNLVDQLVLCSSYLKDYNNLDIRNKRYYLKNDFSLTMETKEWTELYNKVKFVFKLLSKIEESKYNALKKLVLEFETSYILLLLHDEQGKRNN